MTYLKSLEMTTIGIADTLSYNPPKDTLIYIHIGGSDIKELETALDCIFLDNKRSFKFFYIRSTNMNIY